MGIAFVLADGTAKQCVHKAMEDMGASVLNGGFSSFLGILVLTFAQSGAFRVFFKMLFVRARLLPAALTSLSS